MSNYIAEYPDGKIITEEDTSWNDLADLETINLDGVLRQAMIFKGELKSLTVNLGQLSYKMNIGSNEKVYQAIRSRLMMDGKGSSYAVVGRTIGKVDSDNNVVEEFYLNGITQEIEKVK